MAQPYSRTLLPQVLADLRALAVFDEALIDVALQATTDLAEHRKIGKVLGARHVSGDLTGCRRLRFDLPGVRRHRFRVVYRLLPDDATAHTVEVIAVGPRGGHAAYAAAAATLRTRPPRPRSRTGDRGSVFGPTLPKALTTARAEARFSVAALPMARADGGRSPQQARCRCGGLSGV